MSSYTIYFTVSGIVKKTPQNFKIVVFIKGLHNNIYNSEKDYQN
jgi:hypothetical protein